MKKNVKMRGDFIVEFDQDRKIFLGFHTLKLKSYHILNSNSVCFTLNCIQIKFMTLVGRNGEMNSKMKGLVEESVLEHWFLSYVDLLQRLQMFTNANEVSDVL